MIERPLHVVFGLVGVLLFAGFVAVLTWVGSAEDYLRNLFADFGGLFGQIAIWVVGIILAVFLFLRLVAFVLGRGRQRLDS